MAKRDNKRNRRKQPRNRRLQASHAVNMPRISMPKTAKKRRQRNSRRRVAAPMTFLKRLIFSARWLSLGLLALAIYAIYTIGMDERFYLTAVPVEGNVTIPAAEIAQASGLPGIHIFAADPHAAAARTAAIPGITSAEVTLRWPSDVAIIVREESPIAVWRQGGQQYWVSADGNLMPARTGSIGLLVIDAVGPTPLSEPDPLAGEIADTAAAADETDRMASAAVEAGAAATFVPEEVLAGALLLQDLRPEINQLYFEPSGGLYFEDGRGWRAYLGTGTDMAQKLVVYETLVSELQRQGITPGYISVSNQERPFYGRGQG